MLNEDQLLNTSNSYSALQDIKELDNSSNSEKQNLHISKGQPQKNYKNIQKNMIKLSTQAFLQYFLQQQSSIESYIQRQGLDEKYGQNFKDSLINKYNNKKQLKIINQQQFRNLFFDKPFLKMLGIKQKFKLTQKQKFNKKRSQKASFRVLQKQMEPIQEVSEYEKLLNQFDSNNSQEKQRRKNLKIIEFDQKQLIKQSEIQPKLILKQEKSDLYEQWLLEQPSQIQKQAAEKKLLRSFALKFFSKDFILYCLNSKMQYPIKFFRQQEQILKILSLEDIL